MEKGYYKEIEKVIDYKENDVEHKDVDGKLLYIEHLKEPIIKTDKVWVDYTQEELINNQIHELKMRLRDSDYQAIKYAEGQIPETEYTPIKERRQGWRDEINRLQQQLATL